MSTSAKERPAREERFHSEESASMKKRWVFTPVRPSVMAGVKNRERHRRGGFRQDGLYTAVLIVRRRAISRGLPGARHLADEAGVQRQTASCRAATLAAFRLNHQFACGVIEHGDADVVIGQAVFKLL